MGEPIKPRPPGSVSPPQGQQLDRQRPTTQVQSSVERLLARYNAHFGTDSARLAMTSGGFVIRGANHLSLADIEDAIRRSGDNRYTGRVSLGDDGAMHVRLLRREGANRAHPEPSGRVGLWRNLHQGPYEAPAREAPRPIMADAAPFGPHAALPPKA